MHRNRTRVAAGLAAAALPLALLAGCGEDEPKPKFEDPTSSAAEPSDSASPDEPSKPTPPAAMKGKNTEGAKAFVEYYFKTMDWAIRTGDTKLLEKQAAPSCGPCAGVVEILNATRENGGRVTGGEHQLRGIELNELEPAKGIRTFRGNMILHASAQTIKNSGIDGADGRYPAGVKKYSILVARDGNDWHIADWRLL